MLFCYHDIYNAVITDCGKDSCNCCQVMIRVVNKFVHCLYKRNRYSTNSYGNVKLLHYESNRYAANNTGNNNYCGSGNNNCVNHVKLPQHQSFVLGDRNSLCVDDIGDKENQQIVQEGLLHCKLTLVDGKRAGDRSWKQVWAVLRGPILCLYKERRDSIPCSETPVGSEGSNSSGGCGNEQIDVRCALVAAADNYTKRKHVLRVNTISGSELLLQAQDAGQMARWIVALQEQANNNNTSTTAGSSLSPVPAHKGIRKLTSFRNRSPTGQSPVNKTRKPTQSEPLSSPKSKTWKGRVAKQLRRIQQGAGSPVSPTAPHPPHPEGATIGIPLEDCPPSTVSEYVPLLVELCTGIVEARGLEIIGIYRVPGNTAAVSSLTEAVNRGLDAAVLDQDQRWSDVNVISSLLKSFFRRLPDSLLTTELYPLFIQADKIEDPHLRMATIRKLVHDLPDHHYETLKYLLFHLKRVVEHCTVNKMEARNLAIVFGPTLVRTADDNMVTMVTDMSHQCRIVETLILHADWCFGDETVERLQLNPSADGGGATNIEGDPALTNHNLLLGNIHKVEAIVKKIVEPGGKSSIKLSSSTATTTTKPLAIVSPSKESRGAAETRWGRSKELEARSTRRADVDGGGPGLLRRGSSAENINKPPSPTLQVSSDKLLAPNGNLKRLKTGREQGDVGLGFSGVRCGSLDSLHDVTISDRPPSHVSDEGSDLLVSLTSTFDAKLRSLLSGSGGNNDSGSSNNSTGGTEASPVNQTTPPALFRDPSLHRAFDLKQNHDTTNKEAKEKQESVEEKEKNTDKEINNKENLSVVAIQNSVSSDNGDKKQTADVKDTNRNALVKLHRSESLNKTEEKNLDCSNKLRRSESLNKDSRADTNNTKLKRSDSLTKNEKTESNLNKRRQLEAGRWNNAVKLKRKTGSTIDRSIKRRHTVGGTKDFDKVNWLDNRQREAEEEEGKKERRTSSPDLSSSRLAGLLVEVVLRPQSLADPNLASRLCNVPLESHV